MSRSSPYLQRRGDTFCFRIAVPEKYQKYLDCTEITKSLATSDKASARIHALKLASACKQLFMSIAEMTKETTQSNRTDLQQSFQTDYTVKIDLNSQGQPSAITINAEPHETEHAKQLVDRIMSQVERGPVEQRSDSEIRLGSVIAAFLVYYNKNDRKPMLKKHQACLPALLDVVGDKAINKLKRKDIADFFSLIQKLPPRWSDLRRQTGCSIRDLATGSYPQTIAQKTFEDTYKASISSFLRWAHENYGEDGFPNVPIMTLKYQGDRLSGERKQRAFTIDELKILFESKSMAEFSSQGETVHQFWLPIIGLYTGARVNEICQLNPQHDIKQEEKTGIWYFLISEDTETSDEIDKSVKGGKTRKVPIHSRLIALGLLDYIDSVKAKRAKWLFPIWKPSRKRASANAEKWFVNHLAEIGLRDLTPGATLLGMHAFRHTLSNAAKNVGVDESDIVGHVAKHVTQVAAGYQGDLWLVNKQKILEQIQFDINPTRPVSPT